MIVLADLVRSLAGLLELVVPAQQLTGTPDNLGSFPFDPSTPLLARSGQFTVTIG